MDTPEQNSALSGLSERVADTNQRTRRILEGEDRVYNLEKGEVPPRLSEAAYARINRSSEEADKTAKGTGERADDLLKRVKAAKERAAAVRADIKKRQEN